ncbi:MAG: C40 family peptidase [Armatimonadota bacterium]
MNISKLILLAIILILISSNGFASQTLTLSLESPTLSERPVSSPTTQQKAVNISAQKNTKSTPTDNSVTVGRVGVVKTSNAAIYKSTDRRSRVLSRVAVETPLAIQDTKDGWYAILLSNGSIGWIPANDVLLMNYDLVTKKDYSVRQTRSPYTSRSGSARGNDHEIIRTALSYTGVKYLFGGTDPNKGMDCSAFVQDVFRQHGISLPRTSRQQATVGMEVPLDQLQVGDRLYFSCNSSQIDHCGIYAGDGSFIHCSKSRNGIGFDSLSSDYWWKSLVTARR